MAHKQRQAFIKQLQIVSREQGIIQLGQFILRNVVYSVRVRLYVNGYALLLSEVGFFTLSAIMSYIL